MTYLGPAPLAKVSPWILVVELRRLEVPAPELVAAAVRAAAGSEKLMWQPAFGRLMLEDSGGARRFDLDVGKQCQCFEL